MSSFSSPDLKAVVVSLLLCREALKWGRGRLSFFEYLIDFESGVQVAIFVIIYSQLYLIIEMWSGKTGDSLYQSVI